MFECPICNTTADTFNPYGFNKRPNAQCPTCGSLERHRMVWLYFLRKVVGSLGVVLHMAPQDCLRSAFKKRITGERKRFLGGSYRSVEYPETDLTDMEHTHTDSVDLFVCIHVLEHIRDDSAALREIVRILRPKTGWCLLMVPLNRFDSEPIDEEVLTDPRDRLLRFEGRDHVRYYAKDALIERMKQCGLNATCNDFGRTLPSEEVERYRLGAQRRFPELMFITRCDLDE